MIKVGLLYGGRSLEHEVSRCSAASVFSAIDTAKYEVTAIGIDRTGRWYVQEPAEIIDDKDFGKVLAIKKTGTWLVNHFENGRKLWLHDIDGSRRRYVDVVFPVLHGTFGEDGTLQGLLELAMVPYVGADVIGSAVGMDKDVAKRLLRDAGIAVVPWITIRRAQWEAEAKRIVERVKSEFGFPVFVKPVTAGSSVGVRKVTGAALIEEAVENAFLFDTKVMVEKAVGCREIECSALGNDLVEVSPPGEVIPRHEFYSYDAKYIDPEGADLRIPADLPAELSAGIRDAASRGYRALCCSGMARVDFFLEKNGTRFYLNEINTLPGFTSISMYPKLWKAAGLSYPELIDRLIGLAFERHGRRVSITTELTKQ
ncbi:MAG TPA: D-alanine--D-alanine ligase family protein [Spirochaetota bacterium]|nr:D-alanine--D-alanine ligase family protein [Spirochaetota bacterium]